ncbi:heterokaryon incompatibility, partial [Leptodontidium sp. MPI-SDFR-AT-0119]
EIPWSQLPPNFSTIIKLARSLGFRYIWIDSLCIIQDDVHDWNLQASQMDSIYRNARLTL